MKQKSDMGPFLVVGCGSIGKRHIRNLLAFGVRNILAYDSNPVRSYEVREEFGVEALHDLESGWAQNPYCAFITTPTSLHIPIAIQAAERGCHLFIEKPLAHTFEGVERLLSLIREKELVSLVGCNMRFHPGLKKVKELIEKKAMGNMVAARVEAGQYLPDWHPMEDYRKNYSARRDSGGGVILDAIHELDYIRWLLGEIRAVSCFAGKLSHLEIETEDTAAIILRFTNGAIGEVHVDYVQRAYSRTAQFIGDEGTIRWDYTQGTVRYYSSISNRWMEFENPKDWVANQMYVDELSHFLCCLEGGAQPEQDVSEGARVLAVALAAKASSRLERIERLQD